MFEKRIAVFSRNSFNEFETLRDLRKPHGIPLYTFAHIYRVEIHNRALTCQCDDITTDGCVQWHTIPNQI